MTGPGPIDDRHAESASHALSEDRLRCLYEISDVLARFEPVDSTVAAVIQRLSEALALRSVILIIGERGEQQARTLFWPAEDRAKERFAESLAHAEAVYAYLSGNSRAPPSRISKESPPMEIPRYPRAGYGLDPIVLPLVVEHDRVFGALQIEPSRGPRESDLLLANAVVNQLALALDRQTVIEARQAAAAAERARAEAQRDTAEHLRLRFEGLLDNLDHVFAWEADTTLKILYVSAHAEPLIGFSRERWLASPSFWSECVHPQDRQRLVKTLQRAFEIEANQRCEHRCIAADGRELWLSTGVHLTGNSGGPRRLQGVSVDITKAKRLEAALREADRRKNEFLAMLAHELRNPLAPIVTATELLRTCSDVDSDDRERALSIIQRQSAQLTRLTDDLLDVARITSGRIKLKMTKVALGDVVNRTLETSKPLIAKHRHRLTLSVPAEPIWIRADTARLEQVLQNLVHNAAKYSRAHSQINIIAQLEDSVAVLRVRDKGVGIPSDLLPNVFDMFTQADDQLARSDGGLGIGLALVKRLVLMHGGEVAVESTDRGSEFTIRLPTVSPPRHSSPAPVTESAEDATALRVLVVDDSKDTAQSLAMLLEAFGHTVAVAHGGLAALSLADEIRPQVAIIDIGLPDIDGYEVAKRLRKEPGFADATLIALTGYGRTRDRRQSRAAGFDHHVVKPANFARLKAILRKAAAEAH